MMKVIVPIAVAHEIKDNSAQLARLEKSQDMGHEIGLFSNSQHQVFFSLFNLTLTKHP